MMRRTILLVLAVAACCSLGSVGVMNATTKTPTKALTIQLDGNGLGVVNFGATSASATKTLTAVLGSPTGHPFAGCSGADSQTAWHDLIVQFVAGHFRGYRYQDGALAGAYVAPSASVLRAIKP